MSSILFKTALYLSTFLLASVIFIADRPVVTATTAAFIPVGSNADIEKLRPAIIARQDWQAKAPVGAGREHVIRAITIHHTATLQKKDVQIEKKMQNLQKFSQTESPLANGRMKPVWFDIPYHYYIAVDGKIAEGRELKFVGDTNTNYDPTGHALVVVEGNFETEQPAAEQLKSLTALTAWLAGKYKVEVAEIKVHNDFAATACPGINLKKLIPELQEKVGEILKKNSEL